MNEEEIAHLLDDKNSKNTKKSSKTKSLSFGNVSSSERYPKSYNSRGINIGDCFAKILLPLEEFENILNVEINKTIIE